VLLLISFYQDLHEYFLNTLLHLEKNCLTASKPWKQSIKSNNAASISVGVGLGGILGYYLIRKNGVSSVKIAALGLGSIGCGLGAIFLIRSSSQKKKAISIYNRASGY
jgi:predicted MFS family arabinose efflux permease